MKNDIYFGGGFIPGHPSGNVNVRLDGDSGLYTRWDEAGDIVDQRPLTQAEAAAVAPQPPPPLTDAERIAAATTALAPLETVAAPYTTADIVDVLLDVKTALGG